jgi:hypothetical protein
LEASTKDYLNTNYEKLKKTSYSKTENGNQPTPKKTSKNYHERKKSERAKYTSPTSPVKGKPQEAITRQNTS